MIYCSTEKIWLQSLMEIKHTILSKSDQKFSCQHIVTSVLVCAYFKEKFNTVKWLSCSNLDSSISVKSLLMSETCLNRVSIKKKNKKNPEDSFLWKGTGTFYLKILSDFRRTAHMSRDCTFCKYLLDLAVIRENSRETCPNNSNNAVPMQYFKPHLLHSC